MTRQRPARCPNIFPEGGDAGRSGPEAALSGKTNKTREERALSQRYQPGSADGDARCQNKAVASLLFGQSGFARFGYPGQIPGARGRVGTLLGQVVLEQVADQAAERFPPGICQVIEQFSLQGRQ